MSNHKLSGVRQFTVKVGRLKKISPDIFLMDFSCPWLARTARPGQFLHLKIKKTILRRPLSIHRVDKNNVQLLFRVRGRGTRLLSQYKPGEEIDIIGPLGNGFAVRKAKGERREVTNILVAGGMGVAPLVFLAQRLKIGTVVLGAKSKKELLCSAEFKKLGFKVLAATDDGSCGTCGTVIDVLSEQVIRSAGDRVRLFCCGPEAMLKAVREAVQSYPLVRAQLSFEQFMGCGLGVCCGCTIQTKHGYKKVCQCGPVFDINEIF